MKTKSKTIKGWANDTSLMTSPNVRSSAFEQNLKEYRDRHLSEYKELSFFDTLRGKGARVKFVIYGWYWRGAWADPTKEIYTTFYK